MITSWRICNKRFAEPDGEGARTYGGRWNPKGRAVVYTSECLPLATLELLVRVPRRPDDQVYIQFTFAEELVKEVESLALLPGYWRHAEGTTQNIGARWLDEAHSAVLSVPSAVVPVSRNYLINPKHLAFSSVSCSGTAVYEFDDRLLHPVRV